MREDATKIWRHSDQRADRRAISKESPVGAGFTSCAECIHAASRFAYPHCLYLYFYWDTELVLRCFAQDVSTGAIRGVVVDASGSRIVKASIVLLNDATGLRYEHFSDSQGRFVFELLPPGDYSARATAEGMSPQVSPGVHVTLGAVTEVEFKLTVAGAHESVTVSAEPKQVETEPRGVSSVVDERAILGLPLNGRRFTDLALLTPGVTQIRVDKIPPRMAICRLEAFAVFRRAT